MPGFRATSEPLQIVALGRYASEQVYFESLAISHV